MILRLHDSGEPVKSLQRSLNKLGSMLLVDGGFGSATADAIVDARTSLNRPGPAEADDEFQGVLGALPDPFPPLGGPGITFIARAEVSGPQEYRRANRRPSWPSEKSGITLGIGYDLQFVNADQLRADWAAHLPQPVVDRLAGVVGVVGSASRLAQVRDIDVPLPAAMAVFLSRSLPVFVDRTRSVYPSLDQLAPARRTALVSLVYNRGARLEDRDPALEDRREMRAIARLLASGTLDGVADQLEAMTRLWDAQKQGGLVRRRRDEATLWRAGFVDLKLD